jgi:D-alanine-D-alanine ligase
LFGIKYTGTGYLGSALAMDKGMTKQLFLNNNVPTPKGIKLNSRDIYNAIEIIKSEGIKYPCVVKPCCGGSSIGVSIPNNDEEFVKAVQEAFGFEENVIVEEYIEGREFSIGVIGGEALPIIEIIPLQGFYDYKNKYQVGMTKDECPASISPELTKKMQEEAVHASRVLQLDTYSRIDFISDSKGEIYCLEANTLPGMTPTSLLPQEAAVLGIEFPELCERLIQESMKTNMN